MSQSASQTGKSALPGLITWLQDTLLHPLQRAGSIKPLLAFVAFVASMPLALAQSVSVIDDSGKTVRLAQPAQRIISLAPHLTELLFEIGAEQQVVGVIEFSDYPPQARTLPRIGGYRGLDLERIHAARPDLVIAWESGNSAAQVARLENLAITVYRNEPHTLEDIALTLERLGKLTGRDMQARHAAQALRARIESLRAQYAARAPVRVFYQVWRQPLMTVGGRHVLNDVMHLCGGRNIFANLKTPSPTVNAEAVLARAPQIIVGGSVSEGDLSELIFWKRWRDIPAVRNNHLVVLDASTITRHTSRLADGAASLCAAIDRVRTSTQGNATSAVAVPPAR